MSLSGKLERRFGFLAVPGLLRYVAALTALVFILYKINPSYLALIDFNRVAIVEGQWWRLITYIFIPGLGSLIPTPDWFNAAFSVFFLIWAGDRLEEAWGALRLTLFFLVGMIGTTIAALVFDEPFSNSMLIMSIFFAFARFYPDVVILFAYIVPMKVKWIAWVSAAYICWKFLMGTNSYRGAVVAALVNYFIFFGRDLFREAKQHREVSVRKQRFESEARTFAAEPLHKCKVCGTTEVTDPYREFRVARDGEEYCLEHLPSAQGAPTS